MVGQVEWNPWHEGKELWLLNGTHSADVSLSPRLDHIISLDLNISVKIPLKT